MSFKFHLCIHGHFYQPPRENPWTEEIEEQDSARPFHDWNERIHEECYLANAHARILDEHGQITDIVNNFESMSFNFGPTLLSWMERKHPNTYQAILDADKESLKTFHGHGNAIAQVYNHIIMTLANERDQQTQIEWGLRDFEKRFGRKAEAMWLAETACSPATLQILKSYGMKYVILEPHQAEAIRPLSGGDWQDVSEGNIDPRKPYRAKWGDGENDFLDIFFFDGPVSKAVSFDDVLQDANHFWKKLSGAHDHHHGVNQIVNIATDGETYGHHKAFGDRVLAYLTRVKVDKHAHLTNYANYLEKHSPEMEVRIKEGDNGEGTSWSCNEGVKRWKDHTDDCKGMGGENWNQEWRKPLRESLDWLRDEAAKLFEKEAGLILKDPWQARNEYIDVILDRSQETASQFIENEAKKDLSPSEIIKTLKLMEMQRHALLMYTSCGWFFEELSRIETVQILTYAARVMEYIEEISGLRLESKFIEKLKTAESNLPEFGNGEKVFKELVLPQKIGWDHLVNEYAIQFLLKNQGHKLQTEDLYCYEVTPLQCKAEHYGHYDLQLMSLKLKSKITTEEREFLVATLKVGSYDFRTSVKSLEAESLFEGASEALFTSTESKHVVEMIRCIDEFFGESYYALKDVPRTARCEILNKLIEKPMSEMEKNYEVLYEESCRLKDLYHSMHLRLPDQVRYAAQYCLRSQARKTLSQFDNDLDIQKCRQEIEGILYQGNSFDISFNDEELQQLCQKQLMAQMELLTKEVSAVALERLLFLSEIAEKLKIQIMLQRLQNPLHAWLVGEETPIKKAFLHTNRESLHKLLLTLYFAPEHYLK